MYSVFLQNTLEITCTHSSYEEGTFLAFETIKVLGVTETITGVTVEENDHLIHVHHNYSYDPSDQVNIMFLNILTVIYFPNLTL
jgi:sucrase-isomaltase/oligo-1,6-glucosidase